MTDNLSDDIVPNDECTPFVNDLQTQHIDETLNDLSAELSLADHSTPTPPDENNNNITSLQLDDVNDDIAVLPPPCEEKAPEVDQLYGRSNYISPSRLIIASWKIRQYNLLQKALKPGVVLFQYKSDSILQSILSEVKELLSGLMVTSIAFVSHGNSGTVMLTKEKVLSVQSVKDDVDVLQFFFDLATDVIDKNNPSAHLDFLSCNFSSNADRQIIEQTLQEYIKIPVFTFKDIYGSEPKRSDQTLNIGEFYFDPSMLRSFSAASSQSITNYEKIRTIGRGAYGTAVLYRKKDDDSLVVLKEISILDLNATERLSAMNEVKVLGMLSHPNIISYYDSFDEDGTLMIEMEYADGGTLYDFLGKQENDLEERDILIMFSQMVSAIKYCHDNNILHRDLKTQNIFLTQDVQVKLGDFGIAKIMSTHNAGNFTVVGTPYYISPEMCEGKPYDNKSDVWALGCILYEMANLTRTFDGTNLPALITKIVKGTFAPIKETYSPEFRMLVRNMFQVRDLLQKDPNARPDAEEILFNRLAELLQKYDDFDEDNVDNQLFNYGRTRSLLYYCDVAQMQLYPILDLPIKMHISEVSIGLAHVVAVSLERGIYAWGDNSYGQLGVGDYEPREKATEVQLRGKSIVGDNGIVLTCGQGEYGCLGHGDSNSLTRPKLVDGVLTLDVASVHAGSYHQVLTTTEGEVYSWGCGEDGRLGHGNEDNLYVPTKVKFSLEHVFIQSIRCSNDGTVFVADTGTIFACGRNQGDKLGLNPRQGFLSAFRSKASKYLDNVKEPTVIKDLCRYQVMDMRFGTTHFAVLNEFGRVYTNGNNTDGQLGIGNTKPRETISVVKGLEDKPVSMIACGSTFTFAGIQETSGKLTKNSLYFWGTKPKRTRTISASDSMTTSRTSRTRKTYEEDSSTSDMDVFSNKANDSDTSFNASNTRKISNVEGMSGSGNRTKRMSGSASERRSARSAGSESSRGRTRSVYDDIGDSELDDARKNFLKTCLKGNNTQTLNLVSKDNTATVVPQVVFQFHSIGGIEGYDEGEEFPVVLQEIKCFHDHFLIHLETNAPPPRQKRKVTQQKSLDSSVSSNGPSHKEESSEASEMETSGEIPTWIRNELEDGIPLHSTSQSKRSNSNSSSVNSSLNHTGTIPTIVEKIEPLYIDSGNVSDDSMPTTPSVEKKEEIKLPYHNHRQRSFDSLSRRGSNLSRDPNFNLVPKLKKMGSMLRIKEDTLSETTIIDGVAVTTSLAPVQSVGDEKIQQPPRVAPEITARSTDQVEYTTVQNINLSTEVIEDESDELPKEESPKDSPIVSPRAKNQKIPLSKARLKRTQQNRGRTEAAYRPTLNPSYRNTRLKSGRVSSASDVDERVERKKTKKKDEEEKNIIDEIQRQAKQSEQFLREEMQKIQNEKQEREDALKKMHELQLLQREELSRKQEEESKEKGTSQEVDVENQQRESLLKNEISQLKSDLTSQNSKLEDNYNILISLQQQLTNMQKREIDTSQNVDVKVQTETKETTPSPRKTPRTPEAPEPPSSKSDKNETRNSPKSSVCVVM